MTIVLTAPAPVVFTEDFESYPTGAWVPGSNNWSEIQAQSTIVYTILAASGSWSDQHLRTSISAIDTSIDLRLMSDEAGVSNLDGTLEVEVDIDNTTNNNTRPYFYIRYVDDDNYIQCYVSVKDTTMYIVERNAGVSTSASIGVFWSFNVIRYVRIIASGTSIQFDVFSDAARTTLIKSVSKTVSMVTPGSVGIGFHSGYTNDWIDWDNFVWTS